ISGDEFHTYLDSAYLLAEELNDKKRLGEVKLKRGKRYFKFGNLEKAKTSLMEAIELSEKGKNPLVYARANHFLGSTYANQDDYYTSITHYEIAKEYYEKEKLYDYLSHVIANMGWSYRERGDLKEAMDVYMKALRIAEEINSQTNLFNVYHELGYIYIEQGDTSLAEETFKKTLAIAETLDSKERISYANGDLAILYFRKKEFEKALFHNKQDLKIQRELGNNRDLPMIFNNIADCFFKLGIHDSTVIYAEKSLAVDVDQRSTYENAQSKIKIAKANIAQDKYTGVNKLLMEALEAGKATGSIDVKRNSLNQLYLLARKTNDYKSALIHFESYKSLQDSIFNLTTNRQIEEIKAAYELDKSEQKIINLDLERQNAIARRNLYFVAFVLMVIIGIISFLYNRLIRIKNGMILRRNKKIADAQLDKAKSELELYTKMLSDKNKLIQKLNDEYGKVKGEIKILAPDSSKKIKKLIKSTLLTDNEWIEFKERFEQIYPSFFIQLREKYPGLTTTEEKLFALSKLNLKNKEIGSMLGVSPSSVTKSKYRLGKKLDVVPDQISEIAANI
ncbi:MAG: tetratricopeptide repeat protein, partial [Bacteroidota bacterium]